MGELSFSQRMGLKPVRTAFQIDDMDEALRNALWNYCYNNIFKTCDYPYYDSDILSDIWTEYMNNKIIDENEDGYYSSYFSDELWNNVYELLEFIVNQLDNELYYGFKSERERCVYELNIILEKYMSGYRFVGTQLTPITNEDELKCIEEAIENDMSKIHLKNALEKLSDRQNPDYRNSVKESISAVEAICRKLTGKSTLGQALDVLKNNNSIDGQFKSGLEKLYNYTNNEKTGIRHALMEEGYETDFADAKYMLVMCSAFVNYLTDKTKEQAK